MRDLRSQHGVRRAQDTVYNYAIDYRVIGNTLSRDAGSATTYQGTAVVDPRPFHVSLLSVLQIEKAFPGAKFSCRRGRALLLVLRWRGFARVTAR